MASRALSRKAALAMGALAVYLNPKMAADAKVDLGAILKGVTAKNWIEHKPKIKAALDAALAGKLAQDADIADVVEMLDQLDGVTDEVVDGPVAKDDDMSDVTMDDDAALMAKLKAAGLDDAMCQKVMAAMKTPAAAQDVPPPTPGTPKPPGDDTDKTAKQAMDAAIANAVRQAEANTIARLNAVHEAQREVRPYVGELLAQDTALGVYQTALKTLGVDVGGITDPGALRLVLKAQPLPGSKPATATIAQDAGAAKGFFERYPAAARLSV